MRFRYDGKYSQISVNQTGKSKYKRIMFMDDPAKFATLTEYQILMWFVGLLVLSEYMIMFA